MATPPKPPKAFFTISEIVLAHPLSNGVFPEVQFLFGLSNDSPQQEAGLIFIPSI
jgi:hypothetical protein